MEWGPIFIGDLHPRKFNSKFLFPWKMVRQEDVCLSCWVSVTFQGRTVKLQVGILRFDIYIYVYIYKLEPLDEPLFWLEFLFAFFLEGFSTPK